MSVSRVSTSVSSPSSPSAGETASPTTVSMTKRVGKRELAAFARTTTWSDFRDGVAILACAKRAFPESYDACTPTPVHAGRGGTAVVVKQPFEVLRAVFAREGVPEGARAFDKIAKGEFNATFNTLAVLFWIANVRKVDHFAVEFTMKLDGGVEAYCRSAETRARARERELRWSLRRTRSANATPIGGGGDREYSSSGGARDAVGMDAFVPMRQSADASKTTTAVNGGVSGQRDTLADAGKQAQRKSLSIDDWETLTEVRWELEKTKQRLEARERQIAMMTANSASTTTHRANAIKIRELNDLLTSERNARVNLASMYENEVKLLRDEVAEVLRSVVLTDKNMKDFNGVDVSTKEGRQIAQVMIDVMDRVRKVHDDLTHASAHAWVASSASSPSVDAQVMSPSFLARLDSLELSEDSGSLGGAAPPLYAFDQRNEGSVPDEMFGSADSDDFSQMKTAHEGSHDSLRSLHSARGGDDL
jgi:hypothetical protein